MTTSSNSTYQKPLFWLLSCILYLAALPTSHASPVIQHWTTANGARVYFVQAPELPMIDIQFIFDAGSARDQGKDGLAMLTSALLDQGAGKLDADEIATRLEDVGAQLSTGSHRDMAIISLRSLVDKALLQPALDTLRLILHEPSFPIDSYQREKKNMLVALRAQAQSPGDIARKAYYAALYGQHPYATPPLGTVRTLTAIKREDVIHYHRKYYSARNAIIAVVGSLDRPTTEKLVAKLAAALPTGEAAPPLPATPQLPVGKSRHIDFPSMQTHVLMGQPGMKRGDKDYFPLYVGNHILGGSGLVSRISEEVREKRGLAYSAYSYFTPMRGLGPYTLGLQSRNEKTPEALRVLRSTLKQFIGKGPTEKELQASKQNITGGFPLRLSSNRKIVNNLAMIGFYRLPLDYLDTFIQQVNDVSRQQIIKAFQARIHPDKMITITVGGAAAKTPSGAG